jgi:hypothetical protein
MTSMTDLRPGKWYISISCACGERLVLFADLTEGKGSLHGSFEITCPACGTRACYPAEHYYYEPREETELVVKHVSSRLVQAS